MLLSTDWFFPYWSAIEITAEEETRRFIQQGCRPIVEEFIAGAEHYYLIPFNQERIEATKQQFLDLLSGGSISVEVVAKFQELVSPEYDTESARFMIAMTTKMLVCGHADLPQSKDIPTLSSATIRTLSEWNEGQPPRFEFGEICLGSKTDWDRYIKGLTPRSPAALESYLQIGLISELSFRDLRAAIVTLSSAQRAELEVWYCAVIRRMTAHDDVAKQVGDVLWA